MNASGDDHTSGPSFAAAVRYLQRGWSVIPVRHRSKNPGRRGWERFRLSVQTVGEHFNGAPQNIGVLLGEPSGWIIDVDLDHSRAVELAPDFLPPTPAVFGRASKPRSHWIYRVSASVATKKHRSKSAGMLVELRSTGAQTVFPPSTHESGEPIEWVDADAEPATVEPDVLLDAVKRLADAVLCELGEKVRKPPSKAKPAVTPATPSPPPPNAAARCLAAMLRIAAADQRDGSLRLYACACRAVEHDLDDDAALATIRAYSAQRPFKKAWTDDEIVRRIRDAERNCTRGQALQVDADGNIALGGRDPVSGRLIISPKRTLPTAQAFVREFHDHPEGRTLHSYAGAFFCWRDGRFIEIEDETLKERLHHWLHVALRYRPDKTGELLLVDFESNPHSVNSALETIRAYTHLPVTTTPPAWLDQSSRPPPSEILPCRSLLLHLPTMQRLPPTPAFFSVNALDFDPDPGAPSPQQWHSFLLQLFDEDIESLELLQEWCGYCLTGDTSLQKMLLLVGPKRSGKGTIARVLTELVGKRNVCGPTTSSLAGPFGLQPLLGKSLAIVSDARFSGDNMSTVVERLLCISGEDSLTVDRKFKESVTMKLGTRFMFISNELPRFHDASGALAGRFVVLRLTETFYDREDPELTGKLLKELPGILNWAIEGRKRLVERGHFVQPQSVADAVREIEDLASPVGAFVRDCCDVGSGHRVPVDDLYAAWRRWCEQEGRSNVSTKQTFGKDLAAAVPGVVRRRGTGQQPFYTGVALRGGGCGF